MRLTTACNDPMPRASDAYPAVARPAEPDLVLPPPGVAWDEYLVAGTIAGEPYRTIVQVLRPEDGATSGVTIVEPWHRAGYWTIYSKVHQYLARRRHCAAIVLSNRLVLETRIKPQHPRYADLFLPDREITDSEVLAQVGALFRDGHVGADATHHVLLAGQSTEAFWTRRYITQEHRVARVGDAPVFDGYFPAQTALNNEFGPIDDLDVPVVEVQGEGELIRSFGRQGNGIRHRRPDGDRYRLYEVPGMPHICTRNGTNRWWTESLTCDRSTWSNFPMHEVFHAALDSLVRWVQTGEPAPTAARIETRSGGREIVRDRFGNASGGVRSSYVDVPTATVHATNGVFPEEPGGPRCDFFAWDEAFETPRLIDLYASHRQYCERVAASLDALVADHWLLRDDVSTLIDEAASLEDRWS